MSFKFTWKIKIPVNTKVTSPTPHTVPDRIEMSNSIITL